MCADGSYPPHAFVNLRLYRRPHLEIIRNSGSVSTIWNIGGLCAYAHPIPPRPPAAHPCSRVIGNWFLLELWKFARSLYRVSHAGDGDKVAAGGGLHFGAQRHQLRINNTYISHMPLRNRPLAGGGPFLEIRPIVDAPNPPPCKIGVYSRPPKRILRENR